MNMPPQKLAIIDCGTNTFHLMVVLVGDEDFEVIHRERVFVKLGEGGISKGYITDAAAARALKCLTRFRRELDLLKVRRVIATATSALRVAENGPALLAEIKEKTGITVHIISGQKEAELIFQGVSLATPLSREPVLVMDIGGGSVEFIIGNAEEICYKRSFEIGAQRLLDRFHDADPLSATAVTDLDDFLTDALVEVRHQCITHAVTTLVGSSGSFDTLTDIYLRSQGRTMDYHEHTCFRLPVHSFDLLHHMILRRSRPERLQLNGMIEERVDMIVVASCLIDHVVRNCGISDILVSSYALKEGIVKLAMEERLEGFMVEGR